MYMDSESAAVTRGRCRVCLDPNMDMVALSVTARVFAEEITFLQMLKTCCAIEISASDLKPQIICNHCAKMAEQSYLLRKTCQRTDQLLQEELDGVHIKIEPDELTIKDIQEEDDHKMGVMAVIKDEFTDCVSISTTDGLTHSNKLNLSHPSTCERTHSQHSRKHINRKKNIRARDSFKMHPQFDCSGCKKSFHRKRNLINHKCSNTSKKLYKCSQCSQEFGFASTLRIHARSHTGEKPYECSYCKKRFTQLGHLKTHKLTHTGEKPFACSHCNKRFAQQGQLKSHERTHTGEKAYECSHCSKRFSWKSGLTTHELIHTGENPYECSYCCKRFKQQSNFKRHERTHTGEKP